MNKLAKKIITTATIITTIVVTAIVVHNNALVKEYNERQAQSEAQTEEILKQRALNENTTEKQ